MEKELIEYIVKALVASPDEVMVTAEEDGETTMLVLHVAETDLGKVIGKQGRIAKAMRTVLSAGAMRTGRRASLEICD